MKRPSAILRLAAAAFAVLGMAAPAAAASSQFGLPLRDDFEGYAPGPLSLQFCGNAVLPATGPDDCLGILSGGSIMPGTLQLPAVSGSDVYAGTSILFDIAIPVDYFWPGASFILHSGADPVQVDFEAYHVDLDHYINVFSLLVPAFTTFQQINVGTDANPVRVQRFTLQSASLFAIDDIQMGLETVEPGIPEPASWLMMIVGFGAVGISLRKRHWRAA